MTPAEMMTDAAALLNDYNATVFTPTVLLSYYNQSIQKLQEVLELNNVPVTNETSVSLTVPSGTSRIAFSGTTPVLPTDLVDVRQLWESPTGQDNWTAMNRKIFLPHSLDDVETNQLGMFAWVNQEIKLLGSNSVNDIKIDYIRTIYQRIVIGQINIPVTTINVTGFLTNYMAGLAAYFIGENESRALALNQLASESLERSLGINVKGGQNIPIRRRPYRAAYKRGSNVY